jgi:predicted HTH domain antitoxin
MRWVHVVCFGCLYFLFLFCYIKNTEHSMTIDLKMPKLSLLSEFDLKMMLATKLYEERKLALGYCAELAGISKRAFIELLGKYGVSLFPQTAGELESDIDNASRLFR